MKATLTDLYLAYRQAKSELFFERLGPSLRQLAKFERNLDNRLRALQRELAVGDGWFSRAKLGTVYVTPKRVRKSHADAAVRAVPASGLTLDVQLRCVPSVEFAIVEVLYLWEFGPALETRLRSQVVGYRLDSPTQDADRRKQRKWLYEFWPPKYREFRDVPLNWARRVLERGDEVLVLAADFASFYDTVHAAFLLEPKFVASIRTELGARVDEYLLSTRTLLGAHERYRKEAARLIGRRPATGVPIGALTSRLIANLALAPVDETIAGHAGLWAYRRYVDDVMIVAEAVDGQDNDAAIRRFFPSLRPRAADEPYLLDGLALGRPKCDFQLQPEKIRVHRLRGSPGRTFLDAVRNDLHRLASERRSFPDPALVASNLTRHLVRAEGAPGSSLRVFRDVDRARLERFALGTTMKALRRISSLIDRPEAVKLVRGAIQQITDVLRGQGDWVSELDPTLELLRIALSANDRESAEELLERVEPFLDSTRSAPRLFHRDQEVFAQAAIGSLRGYIKDRCVESVAAALCQESKPSLEGRLSRTWRSWLNLARSLATADLRVADREDDVASGIQPLRRNWSSTFRLLALGARFAEIRKFTHSLPARDPWKLEPATLFLSTRPPSYFDIARRVVSGWDGVSDVFEYLLRFVNAIRGTAYTEPAGSILESGDIYLAGPSTDLALPDPRLILGNLRVEQQEWENAAQGKPSAGLERWHRVARLFKKAEYAARRRKPEDDLQQNLLVLPELSLPQAWLRTVSAHVVQHNPFGLIVGLEYAHSPPNLVSNDVFAVLPGPLFAATVWCWRKRAPAQEERADLARHGKTFDSSSRRRLAIHTNHGSFSVLICSELIESTSVAELLGRVEFVLVPAWNRDTSAYDHLIQSAGLALNSIVAIANNGRYSDCRAWAPKKDAWERDLCRLIERDDESVVAVVLPLNELRQHRSQALRPVPSRRSTHRGKAAPPSRWKPLPPDWPHWSRPPK